MGGNEGLACCMALQVLCIMLIRVLGSIKHLWIIPLIHKSNANDYFREVKDRQIRLSLLEKARQIYEKHSFEHLTVSKRVENLAPEGWDRGTSCLHILRSLYGVDWEERVKVSLRALKVSLRLSLNKLL